MIDVRIVYIILYRFDVLKSFLIHFQNYGILH